LLAVCSLLLVIHLLAASGCGGESAEAEEPESSGPDPVSVEVVELRPERLEIEVALTGQFEAEHSVVLTAEQSGVIESIEFEEGLPVSKGDVLVRMRDEEQRARLKEALAQQRLAQDVYDRTQRLASEDISSIARGAEASASLDEARAKVDLARIGLERTQIVAPFDGVAGSRMVAPGEWIKPEITGFVRVAAIDMLQLVFTIPEPNIALARIGGKIHARVIAFPGERFPGDVFYVSPTLDPATRRLIVKAWVPNADHRLKPGMFANVDVVAAVREGAILVPEAAMVYDRHGTYVWLMDDEGLARKVSVEMGWRQDGRVEIASGLSAGDRVVSTGINKVTAGKPIDPVWVKRGDDASGRAAGKQSPAPTAADGAEG
jgi:membrane fusion protein (multidrug efflux system)